VIGGCKLEGKFVSKYPGAFAMGQSMFALAQGCYAFEALSLIASSPKIDAVVPASPVGEGLQGKLGRLDNTHHSFDVRYYLTSAIDQKFHNENISQAWHLGALIKSGEMLKEKCCFNHDPEFELIYHLRNAAAHGNKFNIDARGKKRLSSHDAHLRWYDGSIRFKISSSMNGKKLLFDFIGPGDVADILTLTAERLKDLERGILGPGVATSIFG
jgi:hypothetical protein